MNDFKSLLDSLNLPDEDTQAVQIPMAPQATMPDHLAQAAQEEAMQSAPAVRAPAQAAPIVPKTALEENVPAQLLKNLPQVPQDTSSSTETRNKTSISGTIPQSDTSNGSETAEARLERLMRELKDERNKASDEASSRKFKADIAKAFTDNIGTFVGGMQAKNTGAHVTPVQTHGYDVGDLVGQVDKKYAGDREALLDQYKQLLSARDRSEQRKYQQDSLQIERDRNKIQQQLADQKGALADNKLTDAEKSADREYGKDYNTFTSTGKTGAEQSIKKLEELIKEVEAEGDGLTASGGGRLSVLPDSFRSRDSINRRDLSKNLANSTLKDIFGSQLSDSERKSEADAYYNDALPNSMNAKIMKSKLEQMKQNLANQVAKAKHYESNRTLQGFKSTAPTTSAEGSAAPYGDEVVKDGKSYKWNPAAGKYQLK